MVNQKITELAELTTAVPEDLVAVVDDPASAAATKKIGFGKFLSTYNISPAESSTGLSNDDLDFKEDFGNVLRYGTNSVPGTTDMTAAIQAAIDSAAGHIVRVPDGVYAVTLTAGKALGITASDVTIELLAGAEIKLSDGQLSGAATGHMIIIGDGSTAQANVNIVGPGRINGNRANNSSSGATEASSGIKVDGPLTDSRISENGIINTVGVAIIANGGTGIARRLHISDNVIVGCGEGILWTDAEYITVSGNHISNIIGIQDGIEPFGVTAKYWVIIGNTIDTLAGSAMDIFSGASYGVISDNIIRNVTGGTPAILINGESGKLCEHIVCSNNVIDTTVNNAITANGFCANISIRGNDIDACAVVGINVVDGCLDWLVADNIVTVTGSSAAIDCWADDGVVSGNICNDNPNVGIRIGTNIIEPTGVQVMNNQCVGNTSDGIIDYATDSIFQGNICKNNNQGTVANISGIRHVTGDDNFYSSNYCYDNQGTPTQDNGIYIQAGSRNKVANNHFFGNNIFPVRNAGTNTSVDYVSGIITFTSTDATPTVRGGNTFKTAGTTAITDFDDGFEGQTITILATASITITDGTPIILSGSVDYTMTDTDTLTLTMFNDQIWQEVARSVN